MITLDDARRHLRIDGNDNDFEIEMKLTRAVALVSVYIGQDAAEVPFDMLQTTDLREVQPVTPEDYAAARAQNQANWKARAIDAAVLLVLGELWIGRESSTSDPLSEPVKNILNLFRPMTYA